jgi:hypothetical protein
MSEVLEKAKEKRVVILNPQRVGLAEQRRQEWVVDAEEGTTIEDIMDPAYWSHMSAQFQVFDHVEVRLETGEWIAELIVLTPGRNYARVFLKAKHDLMSAEKDEPQTAITHKVEFKGPQRKHVVIRIADGAVIQEGIAAKSEAQAWLAAYLKTISS